MESISRLNEIGTWLTKNGESVYGAKALPLRSNNFDWGYLTHKPEPNKTNVYAHIFNWPLDNTLRITGISNTPQTIYYKEENIIKNLSFNHIGNILHINLPKQVKNKLLSNITIEYPTRLEIDREIVAESTFGGFSLNSNNLINQSEQQIIQYDGLRPAHIMLNKKSSHWKVFFPKEGLYKIDISAHNPSKKPIKVELTVDQKTITAILAPNGKIVAEPNEENYTDEFVDNFIGNINIEKPKTVQIQLNVLDDYEIWLNRIWIDK